MKALAWWLAWAICFLVGAVLLGWQGAPSWAGTIGGWVFAWGIMGPHRE